MRSIQAAAEAHEQMTSLLAKGASLATLCQSVAQLLGGSVLVLDEAAQVVSRGTRGRLRPARGAQSYAPHGEHSSAELARALRLSRQMGRSVVAYEADGESCRVMAVIGGDDVLGSMALFHRGELDEIVGPHLRAQLQRHRHRAAVAGAHGGDEEPRRLDAAALAGVAAAGRAGAAGEPRRAPRHGPVAARSR